MLEFPRTARDVFETLKLPENAVSSMMARGNSAAEKRPQPWGRDVDLPMIQPSIFDTPPLIRSQAPRAARPRLSKQCAAILARLERGSASNRELAAIALKYSGRVSELRQAGYPVRVISQDHATGLVIYALGER